MFAGNTVFEPPPATGKETNPNPSPSATSNATISDIKGISFSNDIPIWGIPCILTRLADESYPGDGNPAGSIRAIVGLRRRAASRTIDREICANVIAALSVPERKDEPERRTVVLTANEHDLVLRLLRGEKAPAIAADTGRSVHTIRTTIRGIYDKVGIRGSSELANAVARGELALRQVAADRFSLASALRVLTREASHATGERFRSVRLHPQEIRALRDAARAYDLLASTQDDIASLVDRIERLVTAYEGERITLVREVALLLGAQDARTGVARDAARVDALATVFANTPFVLRASARASVLDAFRTSYAAGCRTERS